MYIFHMISILCGLFLFEIKRPGVPRAPESDRTMTSPLFFLPLWIMSASHPLRKVEDSRVRWTSPCPCPWPWSYLHRWNPRGNWWGWRWGLEKSRSWGELLPWCFKISGLQEFHDGFNVFLRTLIFITSRKHVACFILALTKYWELWAFWGT